MAMPLMKLRMSRKRAQIKPSRETCRRDKMPKRRPQTDEWPKINCITWEVVLSMKLTAGKINERA